MDIKPCPYPCGWDELTNIITKTASYFAVATLDDEIPEEVRQSGIKLGKWALELSRVGGKCTEGYVLVPIEPTEKMLEASLNENDDPDNHWGSAETLNARIYKAMIAAAQDESK